MELIFSTEKIARQKRYDAWQEAICDVYVHVDVHAEDRSNYDGFIRATEFGEVMLTDILLGRQVIARRQSHLSHLDKDCYYVQLLSHGRIDVAQSGRSLSGHLGSAAIFCASEKYELRCIEKSRSLYLELPREAFSERFSKDRAPLVAAMTVSGGLGRVALDFCSSLATQSTALDAVSRSRLGSELMDVLALAFDAPEAAGMSTESSVTALRLRAIKQWIDDHLADPDLSLAEIAEGNEISVRYLHHLFKSEEMSASEWIWDRRLQRCHDILARARQPEMSITEIAFGLGFNSSSHFSTLFRKKFGLRPSEVRRGILPQ